VPGGSDGDPAIYVPRLVRRRVTRGPQSWRTAFDFHLADGRFHDGHHAHHVFPKAFEDLFRQLGIDVNRYGAWWEAHAHLKNAHQYNEAWNRFFDENPTTAGAFELARRLMRP